MPDVTKTENGTLLLSLDHGVHVSLLDDVRTDDFCTRATEYYGQKCSNFDDGIADDRCFEFGIEIEFFLSGRLWIFGHEHQFLHHALNRFNEQCVDVLCE